MHFGALYPPTGSQPKFAQICLHDPANIGDESRIDIRINHMQLPSSMSSVEKEVLRELVTLFEENLSIYNSYKMSLHEKISRRKIWVQKRGLYFMRMQFQVANMREDTAVQDYQSYAYLLQIYIMEYHPSLRGIKQRLWKMANQSYS